MMLSIAIACLVLILVYTALIFFTRPKLHGVLPTIPPDPQKPRVILTCTSTEYGGQANHVLSLYQALLTKGSMAILFVRSETPFQTYLLSHSIPHYTTNAGDFMWLRPLYHFIIQQSLSLLCKRHNIDVIQCNDDIELEDARTTAKKLLIKIAYTRHSVAPRNMHRSNKADAIIGVSCKIKSDFECVRNNQLAYVKHILHIPPLFNINAFKNYSAQGSRSIFFKENFNIQLADLPIITSIAHFYGITENKNHQLLFNVAMILINERKKPITIVLAGTGRTIDYFKRMAASMGLAPYVHFLGFCSDIPALLHHSDVMVLPSIEEACPIVYMEAGLMRKPSIGAYGTGAEDVLVDGQTGLLFKNNDIQDLADKIEFLIDNPDQAVAMGNAAYQRIAEHFLPDVSVTKYEKLYQTLKQEML